MSPDEEAILSYLEAHCDEPPVADSQRQKAANPRRAALEQACPKFETATH